MSNSTEIMGEAIVRPGLEALEQARGFTLRLVEAIAPAQMVTRACPGANHTAYVIGHIAWTDDAFVSMLSGGAPALPGDWASKFGMKVQLSDDPSFYPGKDELISAMDERREALVGWLGSLGHDELVAPIEGDLAEFARTLSALPGTLAFHEGFHAGQMSACRRALGLPVLF